MMTTSLTYTLNGKSTLQIRLNTTTQLTGASMVQLKTKLDSVLQLKAKVLVEVATPFLLQLFQRPHLL